MSKFKKLLLVFGFCMLFSCFFVVSASAIGDDLDFSSMSINDSPVLMSSVPVSGSATGDPVVIGYDYAPDAPSGSLLSVLYEFVGKPITAIHYQYRTGNNTNIQTVYSTAELDYDAHWLASVALLMLFIFCIFRLGGSLLCRK